VPPTIEALPYDSRSVIDMPAEIVQFHLRNFLLRATGANLSFDASRVERQLEYLLTTTSHPLTFKLVWLAERDRLSEAYAMLQQIVGAYRPAIAGSAVHALQILQATRRPACATTAAPIGSDQPDIDVFAAPSRVVGQPRGLPAGISIMSGPRSATYRRLPRSLRTRTTPPIPPSSEQSDTDFDTFAAPPHVALLQRLVSSCERKKMNNRR
jgi:hypothetical protein